MPTQLIESILAADIGSTLTHACLVDKVDGRYRLVAQAESPTTPDTSQGGLVGGLRRAIQRIEYTIQRRLLDEAGDPLKPERNSSGDGVDAMVITANAAPPLSCVLVGLTGDLSTRSARLACATNHVRITETILLGKGRRRWSNETLSRLRHALPDLILMVGGTDNAPTRAQESAARILVAVYADIEPELRPVFVFAGNQEARRPVGDIVSDTFDYRVVDNVRPDFHSESLGELQREVAQIYEQAQLASMPGYDVLSEWSDTPIISTAEGLSKCLRFMAHRNELSQGVLGVDIGASSTYLGAAQGDTLQWAIGADLGTSRNVHQVVDESSLDDIRRWLPIEMDTPQMESYLENSALRPNSVPQSMEDLFLVHAVARQALLISMRRLRRQYWHRPGLDIEQETTPPFDLIAARGSALARTPQDGILALSILDAVQPTGLARLVVDWASMWPALGAVSLLEPLAAAQVIERDSFRELGTVIAPIGEARDGEMALSVRILPKDGPEVDLHVPAGTIHRHPLALGEHAVIEVRPSARYDIGLGRRGMGGRASVRGGSLGLIFDTRGRPLLLPHDPRLQRVALQEWLGNLMRDDNGTP